MKKKKELCLEFSKLSPGLRSCRAGVLVERESQLYQRTGPRAGDANELSLRFSMSSGKHVSHTNPSQDNILIVVWK